MMFRIDPIDPQHFRLRICHQAGHVITRTSLHECPVHEKVTEAALTLEEVKDLVATLNRIEEEGE